MSALIARVSALYQPSPAAPQIVDEEARRRAWMHWRWRMFAGFFFGYALLYFCRKNISAALPVMARDLGQSNVQLGAIGTSLYVTYGLGKFLNGVLADRSNIRTFMATGLVLSGVLNLWFGTLSSLWVLAFAWGANGWFQSMGFPPIARGMTLWFAAEGKATRWAFWTCSHQAGTALVMAFTGWILTWGTWRDCFTLPGWMCIASGIVLLFVLADTPESRGLQSVQAFADDPHPDPAGFNFRAAFIQNVLRNRNVWAIGLIDLCVYAVRFGTLDWATKFLIEEKGYAPADAAFRASLMPAAGVVGVLVTGYASDRLFRGRYREVNAIALFMLVLCIGGFYAAPRDLPWLELLCMAGIGFFVEGPQSILGGVGAIDAAGSARVASSAAGLVGILSYTGASLSGVGTGWFIDHYRWAGAFAFWMTCTAIGLLLCLFVWRERPTVRPQT